MPSLSKSQPGGSVAGGAVAPGPSLVSKLLTSLHSSLSALGKASIATSLHERSNLARPRIDGVVQNRKSSIKSMRHA